MRLHGALALHVRTLLAEIDPSLDAEVVADLLLGAIAAGVVHHLRRERDVDLPAVQSAARALLRGLTRDSEPRSPEVPWRSSVAAATLERDAHRPS
jgi:hypothetical protein